MLDIISSDVADAPNGGAGEWRALTGVGEGGFDGQITTMWVRALAGGHAEARFDTGPASVNRAGNLHGGFMAAAAEKTLFLPLYLHDRCTLEGTVTIDFTLQYLAPGNSEAPLFARIELLRETGRMGFVRGTISQNDTLLLAYAGTIRKISI